MERLKKSTSNLLKYIGKHKLLMSLGMIFLICCTLNCIFIFNFMKLLTI